MAVVDDLVELLVRLAILVPQLLGEIQPLVVLDRQQLDHLVAERLLITGLVRLLLHQRKGHVSKRLDVALLSRSQRFTEPLERGISGRLLFALDR